MFDDLPPSATALVDADDAAVAAAIEGWARLAAAADAQRLGVIAELADRRLREAEHPDWACDDWDAAAAEVAAALNVSHGRALRQIDLALALRDRLPAVGAMLRAGAITTHTATVIVDRTALVEDSEALQRLDAAISERAANWGPLSDYKLKQALDVWIDRIDPGALRRTRDNVRSRDFVVGGRNDDAATTEVWGRLQPTDALRLQQRLTAMARGVCPDDPRTLAQRRADAVGALAANSAHLKCLCGNPACSAATDDGRATGVVIHVLAETAATRSAPDPLIHGDGRIPEPPAPARPAAARPAAASDTAAPRDTAATPSPTPAAPPDTGARSSPTPNLTSAPPALLIGGGHLPAPLLAELLQHGAQLKPVTAPSSTPESRYRPSAALDTWIRLRDLTCRYPGCDQPAVIADIDHTTPYPAGLTHPANLSCRCRKHHLLKTFWDGWTDVQAPDGSITFTTPSGRRYVTKPGATLLFPEWDITTAAVANGRPPEPGPERILMMPKRRRTRAQSRAAYIKAERAHNDAYVAERNEPPPF